LADPAAIQFSFDGADNLELQDTGDLVLGDHIRLRKPMVYQGERRPIDGRFALEGRRVRFKIGDYDHSQPLVIDPALDYSTYLGTGDIDEAAAMAVDHSGNVYITGSTWAEDPTGEITDWHIWTSAFVHKLNPSGTQLIYSTYLGGSGASPDRR